MIELIDTLKGIFMGIFLSIVLTVAITLVVKALLGMLGMIFKSLTFRAYSKVFLEVVIITSLAFGIYYTVLFGYKNLYALSVLGIGSMLLFLLSFRVPMIRRRTYLATSLWCGFYLFVLTILNTLIIATQYQ